ADVLRVQVPLDTLGAREAAEDLALLALGDLPMRAGVLEPLPQPQALPGAGNVRELGGQLAAVDLLQQRENVAQLHSGVTGAGQAARVKLAVEVRGLDTEEVELQHGGRVPLPQPERIEIRDLVPAQAIDLDQARDRGLLLAGRRIRGRRDARRPRAGLLGEPPAQRFADRAVGNVAVIGTDAVEEAPPYLGHATWRFEVGLIERLDERSIRAL